MKVWQLIAELSKLPAGTDVLVTAYPDGTLNNLHTIDVDDDAVHLKGSGQYDDDRQGTS